MIGRPVTAGEGGSHFQRHHRYPGTHPVARRRYSAVPLAYGRAARLRGNSGIDLLLPGEADGGFVADRRHLDVGWYQSRHHPPSRTINQSSRVHNPERAWSGTWSPAIPAKVGPTETGDDRRPVQCIEV